MSDILDAMMFGSRNDLAKLMRHYRKLDTAIARLIYKRVKAARAEFYGSDMSLARNTQRAE